MAEAAQRLAVQLGPTSDGSTPASDPVKTTGAPPHPDPMPASASVEPDEDPVPGPTDPVPAKPKGPAEKKKKSKAGAAVPLPNSEPVNKNPDPAKPSPGGQDPDPDGDYGRGLTDDERLFVSSLSDDNPDPDDDRGDKFVGSPPDVVELKQKYDDLQVKVKEYESVLEDPLVSAFTEFVKSGNTDVNEFAKQVGSLNFGEMSVEDMYRMRAQEMGFGEDDLEDAVFEQMDKFNSMTRIEKKDEETKLKSIYKSQSAERLKSFTEKVANKRSEEQARVAAIVQSADAELEDTLSKMKGGRWKSLAIDEPMVNNIREAIPALAPLMGKFDDKNQLIGFDVKEGVEMAIWKLYGKQLLKSTFDIGRTSGFEEAMKDRIRPSARPGVAAGPAAAARTESEDVKDARQAAAKKNSGRKSLFDL